MVTTTSNEGQQGRSLSGYLEPAGAQSFFGKNSQVGDRVEGVVESVNILPYKNFQTGQVETWPDGGIKEQAHIVLRTNLEAESADDDGRRSLWVKMWGVQLRALREATDAAGVKDIVPGDRLSAQFTGYGERGKAPQPPKLYKFVVTPKPSAMASKLAPQTAQQTAAPATPAPAPATSSVDVDKQTVLQLAQIGQPAEKIAEFVKAPLAVVEEIISTGGAEF
ncbi:hypothetical protein B9G54_01675 [Alloscardovia macacae]|uniref:Uncharacterized protein n=1 Tax=Alloscardovia macacae TaxID=1160091 RepID=A0A1Y2SW01_9BIFI|nr:hypothetical protein [Alloscardovia macacae]OTA27255.1 hypothetical protein B9G54_01675 [Alloscardovia macacae]OTA29265.1 hypothetical protein B9T39_03870 [Alloscardovia macacae]